MRLSSAVLTPKRSASTRRQLSPPPSRSRAASSGLISRRRAFVGCLGWPIVRLLTGDRFGHPRLGDRIERLLRGQFILAQRVDLLGAVLPVPHGARVGDVEVVLDPPQLQVDWVRDTEAVPVVPAVLAKDRLIMADELGLAGVGKLS